MLINRTILKQEITKKLLKKSIKIAAIVTIGIIFVFALNFLHILNIYFGMGVLAIVILILLII